MSSHVSDFAKAQLLKYGWSEGKGLGKEENGIVNPIKPKVKNNTEGVGFTKPNENWWESAMNKSLQNIQVTQKPDSTISFSKISEPLPATTSKLFMKSAILQDGTMTSAPAFQFDQPEIMPIVPLSDEELFKACGGRTAHKGARHGLEMSGKLARIEQQEMAAISFEKVEREDFFKKIIQREKENHSHKAVKKHFPKENDNLVPLNDDSIPIAASSSVAKRTGVGKKYKKTMSKLTDVMDKFCIDNNEKPEAKEEIRKLKYQKIFKKSKKDKTKKAMVKAMEMLTGESQEVTNRLLQTTNSKKIKEGKPKRKGKKKGEEDVKIILNALKTVSDDKSEDEVPENKFDIFSLNQKNLQTLQGGDSLEEDCVKYVKNYLKPSKKKKVSRKALKKIKKLKEKSKQLLKEQIVAQMKHEIANSNNERLKDLSNQLETLS